MFRHNQVSALSDKNEGYENFKTIVDFVKQTLKSGTKLQTLNSVQDSSRIIQIFVKNDCRTLTLKTLKIVALGPN